MVYIHSETQSLLIEFLRAIHVRDVDDDCFQFEIHWCASLRVITPFLILFTESLDIRFAVWIEEILAALTDNPQCEEPIKRWTNAVISSAAVFNAK